MEKVTTTKRKQNETKTPVFLLPRNQTRNLLATWPTKCIGLTAPTLCIEHHQTRPNLSVTHSIFNIYKLRTIPYNSLVLVVGW